MMKRKSTRVLILILLVLCILAGLWGYRAFQEAKQPAWSRLEVGGTELFFPFTYEEARAAGFKLKDMQLEEKELPSGKRTAGMLDLVNTTEDRIGRMEAVFSNPEKEEGAARKYSECQLIYFSMMTYHGQEELPDVILAEDLKWGASEEEIKAALGMPDAEERSEEKGTVEMLYETPYMVLILTVNREDGMYSLTFGTDEIR